MVEKLIQAQAIRRFRAPVLVGVILVALFVDLAFRPEPIGVDFHTYAAASLVGLQTGWSYIYDQTLVTIAQVEMPTRVWSQPYLSPPPVAWMVAPLTPLPYPIAFGIWAFMILAVYVAALAWATNYRGFPRVLVVAAAVAPWYVISAVHVGQVAPLIAAGLVVAWRLLRQNRNVAAGVVLTVVLFKPNTALLAPVALAVAGRYRAFTAWVVSAAALVGISALSLGPHGVQAYVDDLMHVPPQILHNASLQTIEGTFGLSGTGALVLRAAIVLIAMVTAYRLRGSPWLAMVVGAMASLMTASYLHPSDICVFVASGWIIWHERRSVSWRALLVGLWFVALPFLRIVGWGVPLNRWLLLELVFFLVLIVDAWIQRPATTAEPVSLTTTAEFSRRAPA